MLTCLAYNLNWSFYNFSIIIKTPIEIIFLYQIFITKKINLYFVIIISLLAIWLIAISTSALIYNEAENNIGATFIDNSNTSYLESFTVFSRYILFFCILPVLFLHKNDENFVKKCKLIFEYFFYVNSLLILLGWIFNLPVFAAYHFKEYASLGFDYRFGYKGLIYGINEVTGVYFLGLSYAYREIFVYNNKNKWVLLLLILFASMLTGAKGCYLSFFLLSIYYFAKYRFRFFLISIFPIVLVTIYYLIHIDIIDFVSKSLNISFLGNSTTPNTPIDTLLTFLTSGRNLYINSNWQFMLNKWGFFKFIFGDGLLYSETDLFDLYYMFGLGAILYFYYYRKIIFDNEKSGDIKYIFFFLMLIAFLGGHIIRSAVIPTFLSIYVISGTKKINSSNSSPI